MMPSGSVVHPRSGLPIGVEVDDTPALRPERVVLEGRFVRLEPLSAATHAVDLYAVTHGENTNKEARYNYITDGPFDSFEDFNKDIEHKAVMTTYIFYAIIDKSTNKAVGYISLMRIDPVHRSIEVGYVLYGNTLKRTPHATESQYLLMRYSFEDLHYRRYEWKCDALNVPSRNAALRLGFVFEGIFRKHFIIKGRSRDTAWFSIVDSEWPVVKHSLELWLGPENIGSDLQQLRSLSDIRNELRSNE